MLSDFGVVQEHQLDVSWKTKGAALRSTCLALQMTGAFQNSVLLRLSTNWLKQAGETHI